MSDAEDISWLEGRHSNEGKNLSPGGDEVLLNRGQVGLGHHVDHVVPSECRGAIASNQVDRTELRIVGQGDACRALVAEMEASTRSGGVDIVHGHACRGVVK